jgi:hypothetical protein
MSRRVSVHHFVGNLTTTQSGPHPTSNLLGVDYWYDVPADAEFPRVIGKLAFFTRFYLRRPTPTEFSVVVRWTDSPDPMRRRARWYGPYLVNFQPTDAVYDHAFRVVNIRLDGVGRYTVWLVSEKPPDWRGRRFAALAKTHFCVEQ